MALIDRIRTMPPQRRAAWLDWFAQSHYSTADDETVGFNDLNEDGTE